MLTTARLNVLEHAAPLTDDRRHATIDFLRSILLAPPLRHERGHAIFFDAQRAWLGDTAFGLGDLGSLSLRMRSLFGDALRLGASGMILAHTHPSGHCRPSGCDIAATRRLQDVGRALDIALIDHLIFTTEAVYSMRAGGLM
ncbi:MAG: DNA repair protein [Erythrobacter sp.]|nr:DNA repair protein [Erythrobacter sp.]